MFGRSGYDSFLNNDIGAVQVRATIMRATMMFHVARVCIYDAGIIFFSYV